MKKKAILLFVVILMLLNGCGCVVTETNVPSVVYTNTSVPTSTPTPLPTYTNTPSPTETPVPTATNTPTPTLVPTPTLGIPVENDLNPSHVQTIVTEYMGVKFNLELITDSSMNPEITKVIIDEEMFTYVMAKNILRIWWVKGSPGKSIDDIAISDDDLKSFMSLWAKAQETNDPEDWQKVQIDNLYANDLNDGEGYVQRPYSVWFMYNGDEEPPDGVKPITLVSVALMEKVTPNNASEAHGFLGSDFYGANLNEYNMIFYLGFKDYSVNKISPLGVEYGPALLISTLGIYAQYNEGKWKDVYSGKGTWVDFAIFHVGTSDVFELGVELSKHINLYPKDE
jgi:hypothetical protein